MARKGTFGSGLTPPLTDLSAYQIGTPPAQQQPVQPQQLPQPAPTQDWYQAAPPPERPTVAPEQGVMPEPVIPTVVPPTVNLTPQAGVASATVWGKGELEGTGAYAPMTLAQMVADVAARHPDSTQSAILATAKRNLGLI